MITRIREGTKAKTIFRSPILLLTAALLIGGARDVHALSVSVSHTILDPASGIGQTSITYKFNNTECLGTYSCWLQSWWNDWGRTDHWWPGPSGTLTFPDNVGCRHHGIYTKNARVQDYTGVAYSSTDVFVNAMPSVAASGTGPNDQGTVDMKIDYDFPNTPGTNEYNAWIGYFKDGEHAQDWLWLAKWQDPDRADTKLQREETACWSNGAHVFRFDGHSCGGNFKSASHSISVNHQPTASIVGVRERGDGGADVIYSWSFPQTNAKGQRRLKLEILPSATTSGAVLFDAEQPIQQWTTTFPIASLPPNPEMLKLTAKACGSDVVVSEAPLPAADKTCCCGPGCKNPSSCFADPIRTTNGNVRFRESDPLPIGGLLPLPRTFDSRNNSQGLFGHNWFSTFDSWLRATAANEDVTIATEGNDRVIYTKSAGSFVQSWPDGGVQSGTLTYESGSGTFVHVDKSNGWVRRYRSTDGRLISYQNLANGRLASISYDAGGLPTRVDDSWGAASILIVTNALTRRITSIGLEARPDRTWSYSYDGAGDLRSVQAPGSAPWRQYTYVNHRLLEARDALGNLIESHSYDGVGRGLSSSGPSAEIVSVQYNLPSGVANEMITRTTSATGVQTDYYSRPIAGQYRTVKVDGHCTCGADDAVYGYDGFGNPVRAQNSAGYITRRTYDPSGLYLTKLEEGLRPIGCDPSTDANFCRLTPENILTTELISSSATRETRYIQGDPNWPARPTEIRTASVLDPAQDRIETFVYHPESGSTISQSISGLTGDPPTRETHTTSSAIYNGTEGAAFDPDVDQFADAWLTLAQPRLALKSVDGPRTDVGDVTTYVYYPIHNSVPANWRGRLAAIQNPLGHKTRFADYDEFGNAGRKIDALGVETTHTFDALGRQLSTTLEGKLGCDTAADPLCATDATTTWTYAATAGPVDTSKTPRENFDGSGGVTKFSYDSRSRLQFSSRGPSSTDLRERIENIYDPITSFNVERRLQAYESPTWVTKQVTRYEYDGFGRKVRTYYPPFGPAGDYDEFGYDAAGNVVDFKDADHTEPNVFYSYDPLGRLSRVSQLLDLTELHFGETTYSYDSQGNLSCATDAEGHETRYTTNDFGNTIQVDSPVSGITRRRFDPSGNLVESIDAAGNIFANEWDAAGLPAVLSPESGGESQLTIFDPLGRPVYVQTSLFSQYLTYNRAGELTGLGQESRWYPFSQFALIGVYRSYDLDGNQTAVNYYDPSLRSFAVSYANDFAGRPVSASGGHAGDPTSNYAASVSYLPFGPKRSSSTGNGLLEERDFDQRYRRIRTTVTTAGDVPILHRSYEYDGRGNQIAVSDLLAPALSRTYQYDDAGRLTAGTGPFGLASWTYDDAGNRLSEAFGPIGNQRQSTYRYADGRPMEATIDGTTFQIETNARGEITEDDRYVYGLSRGTLNSRASRNGPGNDYSALYLHGPGGIPLQDAITFDTADGPVHLDEFFLAGPTGRLFVTQIGFREYGLYDFFGRSESMVYLGSEPIAVAALASPQNTSSTAFVFGEPIGLPTLMTDMNGSVVWKAESEPFGRTWQAIEAAPNPPWQGWAPEMKFPGQWAEPDGSSTIFQNGYRWYDSAAGRYLQPDPIDPNTSNLRYDTADLESLLWSPQFYGGYSYAANNPITFSDPTGEFLLAPLLVPLCSEAGAATLAMIVVSLGGRDQCTECIEQRRRGCKPCIPPIPTLAYRPLDTPARPQHGIDGPHYNMFQMIQTPYPACLCRWQKLKAIAPPLPPMAVPITPAAGGGPE